MKAFKQIITIIPLLIKFLNGNDQYCPIQYKEILQQLADDIEDQGCETYIGIFDRCLTETINTVKNNQGQPFEPYVIPNNEGNVQNVQFLLREDFNYLTPMAAQVFFVCLMRKDAMFKDGSLEPIPPPVPPLNPDNPNIDPPAPPLSSPSPQEPVPQPSPSPSPQVDQNPQNPFNPNLPLLPPIDRSTIQEINCDNFFNIDVDNKRYVNNQWGIDKAIETPKQCILRAEGQDGEVYYGWNWNYSGFDPTIYAYPESLIGSKPWSDGPGTDPDLVRRINQFNSFFVDFELELFDIVPETAYNTAFEIWTTDRKQTNGAIPDAIQSEVMILAEIQGQLRPAGNTIRTGINIDNIDWNLNEFARTENVFWDFYTFWTNQKLCEDINNTDKFCKLNIDVKKFLDYLTNEGLINDQDFVAVAEVGNEIAGNLIRDVGSATAFVKRFEVQYS